jgi:hypothetical protein
VSSSEERTGARVKPEVWHLTHAPETGGPGYSQGPVPTSALAVLPTVAASETSGPVRA